MNQISKSSIGIKTPLASVSTVRSAALSKTATEPKAPRRASQVAQGQVVRRAVRFGLEVPNARDVSVVGTFNRWNPASTPLRCVGGSRWYVYAPLEVGRHEYRFIVDGKWMDDPKAKDFVPNPQGGRNAVLEVVDRRLES